MVKPDEAFIPEIGSEWKSKKRLDDQTVKVMAVINGFVMAKLRGSTPFVLHVNDWHVRFDLVAPAPVKRRPAPPSMNGWEMCARCEGLGWLPLRTDRID